jgi:hypothetical protein
MNDEYERLREQRDAIEARQKKKADEIIVRKCADIVMCAAREYNKSATDRRKDRQHDLAAELESKALVCAAVHQQILREFEL